MHNIANFVIAKSDNQKINRNAFQIEFLKKFRISKNKIENDDYGVNNDVLNEKDKSERKSYLDIDQSKQIIKWLFSFDIKGRPDANERFKIWVFVYSH